MRNTQNMIYSDVIKLMGLVQVVIVHQLTAYYDECKTPLHLFFNAVQI